MPLADTAHVTDTLNAKDTIYDTIKFLNIRARILI